MRRPGATGIVLFCAVLCSHASAAPKEPAEVVYEKVHPSVVSLRNAEGSGTGILIDRNGLVLTNAHVVMSPLRFEAKVDVRLNGVLKTQTFRNVTVVGLHPSYDLALVKIDPSEHRGVLTPATLGKDMPKPGRTVYAIGNPGAGDGVILTKTITSGMLSGIREMEGKTFLQISAAINPGNSGGPLCEADGSVVGIVSFKMNDVDNIGFAIPTKLFTLGQFVPWDKRKSDPQASNELVAIAEKYLNQADINGKRYGRQDERAMIPRTIALRAYWLALMNSPSNGRLYYSVGMVYRTLDADDVALAYLVRAVELEPWGDERGNHFREIGFVLVKLNRIDEGLIAYREGVAKWPRAGKIWEDLSITHVNRKEMSDAAYAAKVAVHVGDSRADVANSIYRQATAKMPGEELAKLQTRLDAMDADLKRSQAAADKANAAKKKYLHADFEALMKKLGTLADAEDASKQLAKAKEGDKLGPADAPQENPATAANPDDAPKTKPKPEPKDPATAWIDKKLDLADLYRSSKQMDKVKEVLREIIDRYPDHPKAKQAKDQLERMK